MNIKFYGHNSYLLKGKQQNVLIDPWLTNKGAFFGSWFQWPINHHLIPDLIGELKNKKKNILYISHEHQDHFDKETLKLIQPLISICIIPKYFDKFLLNEIKKLGFDVIELDDLEEFKISERDKIKLMIVDIGVNHDSAALISIDEKNFLNQNDCKIFDRLNYFSNTKINYYAVQFSGANWHPVCYDYSEEQKKIISNKKALSKLISIKNSLKKLKPDYYFPSAGPAIFPFLETGLSLGENNIFIHQTFLDKFLKSSDCKLCYLRPGETFKSDAANKPIFPPTIKDLKRIRENIKNDFELNYNNELKVLELKDQLTLRLNEIENINFEISPKIIFCWGNKGLEININSRKIIDIDFENYIHPKSYFQITAEKKYFYLMSTSKFRWQDIYLSLRAKVKRNPDIFNTFVNIFVYSDIKNIKKGFETTLSINEDRIVVIDPNTGKNYEINRYCPHNGADLKEAEIDRSGNLICPRHNWAFNLNNKGMCEKAGATINSKIIENTITLCENISARLTRK